MSRVVSVFAVLLVMACAPGCASIFSSGPKSVDFNTEPTQADVLVNGQKMGTTPVTLKLHPSKQYTITYRKEGFKDANVSLTSHVQGGWVVLDILAGVIGVAVDAGTGKWKAFDSGSNFVKLEPLSTSP